MSERFSPPGKPGEAKVRDCWSALDNCGDARRISTRMMKNAEALYCFMRITFPGKEGFVTDTIAAGVTGSQSKQAFPEVNKYLQNAKNN